MRHGIWLVWAVLLWSSPGLAAAPPELEGVRLERRVYIAQGVPELVLNGAGVRHKLLFAKVYVAALYLTRRLHDAADILSDPGPKRIALHVLQEELTAEQLIAALNDGLAANVPAPDLAPLERRLRELAAMMRGVERVRRGGNIVLDYLPGIGTRVSVNGMVRITIPGEDFQRALLRIWLGDRPVDGQLKQALLGGKGRGGER